MSLQCIRQACYIYGRNQIDKYDNPKFNQTSIEDFITVMVIDISLDLYTCRGKYSTTESVVLPGWSMKSFLNFKILHYAK